MSQSGRRRIVIVGGGMAALTAAFEITNVAGWEEEYEITLYQMGWRLGGKGASGRNAARNGRIEEHGLHLFFGFYENACRVLRDCYEALGRDPRAPLATWEAAFQPQHLVVFEEQIGGRWSPWSVTFPATAGLPGDGIVAPTPWDYVHRILGWLGGLLRDSELSPFDDEGWTALRGAIRSDVLRDVRSAEPAPHPRHLIDRLHDVLAGSVAALGTNAGALVLALVHEVIDWLDPQPAAHGEGHHEGVIVLLRHYRDWLRERLDGLLETNLALRHLYILTDLGIACAIGLIDDRLVVPPHDWFSIDDIDFRAWVMKHGASEMSARSAPVNTLYALAFAEATEVGAGTGIHGILRLCFTYQGALIWKMQAGMGETVFAPLYEVLRRRGVRFRFFHRLDRVVPSEDGTRVARLELGQQVTVRGGAEYRPLVDVDGLPCWPSAPDVAQLDQDPVRDGHDLEDWWTRWEDAGPPVVLRAGEDFDLVVLGVSLATLGYVARELMERHQPLADMVRHVATTQTQALQLWLRPDLQGLGWPARRPVVGSFALPFDTWADLTHLLALEDWRDARPGGLAYVCGCLEDDEELPPRTDHEYPARQAMRAKRNGLGWLRAHAGALWPGAAAPDDPCALDWAALVDPEGRSGEQRVEAQYWRATVSPSERYVLSVPGSTRYRLRADESGFANLHLAGDFTFTAINAGCIEAAAMSGMHVSRAICGRPEEIAGDVPKR